MRAEKALVTSRSGKQSVATYAPKAGEKSQKQIDTEWTDRFEQALKKNELRVLFQPIVSLGGDETERFEVQVRMQVNDKEMTEAEFLPIAASIPIEVETTLYPLESANQALRDLKAGGVRGAKVLSINQ